MEMEHERVLIPPIMSRKQRRERNAWLRSRYKEGKDIAAGRKREKFAKKSRKRNRK